MYERLKQSFRLGTEEWFNINHLLVFVACFLLFMCRLCKKQGGMCYTTKSYAVTKTYPTWF
jgi:hypothetical protein